MPLNVHHPRNSLCPKFLGYLRVSKDDETTGSHTFETQELRIREHLDRRCGLGKYELELWRDDGVSGALTLTPTRSQRKTRRTLGILAEKIESKQFDALVIYAQSRLFRNPRGMMEFVEDILLPNDTALLSATENIDISTADGRAMVNLKALFDGMYRDSVVKRNKDAIATARQFGYFRGQVPYGWDWQPLGDIEPGKRRGIVPIEDHRATLLLIKERFFSGWGCQKIAGELNERNISPPSHQDRWKKKAEKTRDAVWMATEVYRILSSPVHAGLLRDEGAEEEGLPQGFRRGLHFPLRLWDSEEWVQIIALHQERMKKFTTVTARRDNPQFLAGLATCARCGRRLYARGSSAKGYRSYRCDNGMQSGQPTCPDVSVRAEWIEEAVVAEIGRLALLPEIRATIERQAEELLSHTDDQDQKEKRQLTETLEKLNGRFSRWAEAFADGTLSKTEFVDLKGGLEEQRAKTKSRLQALESQGERQREQQRERAQIALLLEQFPSVWEHLDCDEKRQVLTSLVEQMTVDRQDRLITMRLKLALLPPREVVIPHRTYQGRHRTSADPITLLTRRELAVLHLNRQGHTQTQSAAMLGVKKNSMYGYAKAIRRKCGGRSLEAIAEEAKERIEATLAYLPLTPQNKPTTGAGGENIQREGDKVGEQVPFLSGVLMQVFPLFASGASVADVADRLNLSRVTVQGRRSKILKLMGTSSMLEAVEKAQKWGIL